MTQTFPQYTPPQQFTGVQQHPQQQIGGAPFQQYQPAPQQTAAPTQGASLPAVPPPPPQLSTGGAATGEGMAWPKMRDLVGRLIIVEPIRMDEDAMDTRSTPPKKRPEAYFNLTVCNGGPLKYGDSQDKAAPRPYTHESDVPARWTNVNSYNYGFVTAIRDALAAGEAARVGVVQYGRTAYLITKPSTDIDGKPRPNGDQLFAEGMAIWTRIWNAKHGGEPFVSPTPRSLVAAPAQPTPQVSYQKTAPAQGATYGTAGGAPQYAYPQPTQYATYQPAGASMQVPTPGTAGGAQSPYMPQGYATQNDGNGVPQQYAFGPAANAQQGYNPGTVPAQPAAAPGPQLPPGVEAWLASLPADQRDGARAQYLAQTSQPAAPQGPGI